MFGFIFAVSLLGNIGMCIIHFMNNGMKRFLLLVSCTLLLFTARAQSSRSPLEDMSNAIRNNRVMDMAKYFDNFVPITINNVQAIYSHNQAAIVLEDFFEKNNPKDFSVMDNGSPDNASKFIIGNFSTPSARYNVYILMKLKDGNYILQEIRLNKE